MRKVDKFKCFKVLINKQHFQVSSLCDIPFLRYRLKYFTHIYRSQYENDARLVPIDWAQTWRPEIKENILHSLLP